MVIFSNVEYPMQIAWFCEHFVLLLRTHQKASECIIMLQNASECFRLHQNAPECIRSLQNALECFRMLQNASDCIRMLQNASQNALECIRMLQNASDCIRLHQNASEGFRMQIGWSVGEAGGRGGGVKQPTGGERFSILSFVFEFLEFFELVCQ